MPLDTFTPPQDPSPGQTGKTVTARTLRAQFGDSYSQRSPDGLNSVTESVVLNWPMLSPTNAQTLDDFFAAKQGATAFIYTLPWEETEKIWTAPSWRRGNPESTHQDFQATLVQEFDLGT